MVFAAIYFVAMYVLFSEMRESLGPAERAQLTAESPIPKATPRTGRRLRNMPAESPLDRSSRRLDDFMDVNVWSVFIAIYIYVIMIDRIDPERL